jgi:integrase
MGLGSCDLVTLAKAREANHAARTLQHEGIDPIANKARLRLAEASGKTFKERALEFIADQAPGWKHPEYELYWRKQLARHAYPVIGHLQPKDITVDDVLKVLRPIWTRKAPTASRLRGRIEQILDYACVIERRQDANPARWRGHLAKLLPAPSKVKKEEHFAALPYAELPAFMVEVRQADNISAKALRLTILSCARTKEVIGAKWAEFDLDKRLWTVPGSRMKGGVDHTKALPGEAVELLRALSRTSDFVFPNPKVKRGHIGDMGMFYQLRRMGRSDITVHGFRSTFKDWASETTAHPDAAVEMALAHVVGNAVERAYRRGDMLEKRMKLADDWGDYCKTAVAALVKRAA